jgi:hypothetical protein
LFVGHYSHKRYLLRGENYLEFICKGKRTERTVLLGVDNDRITISLNHASQRTKDSPRAFQREEGGRIHFPPKDDSIEKYRFFHEGTRQGFPLEFLDRIEGPPANQYTVNVRTASLDTGRNKGKNRLFMVPAVQSPVSSNTRSMESIADLVSSVLMEPPG